MDLNHLPQRIFGNRQRGETLWVAITGGGVGRQVLWASNGQTRDAAKHPPVHRTTPTPTATKTYPVKNVNSAEVEKS